MFTPRELDEMFNQGDIERYEVLLMLKGQANLYELMERQKKAFEDIANELRKANGLRIAIGALGGSRR